MTSCEERELARYAAKAIALSMKNEASTPIDFKASITAVTPNSADAVAKERRAAERKAKEAKRKPRRYGAWPKYPFGAKVRQGEVDGPLDYRKHDNSPLGRAYYRGMLSPDDLPPEEAIKVADSRYLAGQYLRYCARYEGRSPTDSILRERINSSISSSLLPAEMTSWARAEVERIGRQMSRKAWTVLWCVIAREAPLSSAFARKDAHRHHLTGSAAPIFGDYLDQLALAIGPIDANNFR